MIAMSATVLVSDDAISWSCSKARSAFPFDGLDQAPALSGSAQSFGFPAFAARPKYASAPAVSPSSSAACAARLSVSASTFGRSTKGWSVSWAFSGAPKPDWIWANLRERSFAPRARLMERPGSVGLGLRQRAASKFGGAGKKKNPDVVVGGCQKRLLNQLPCGFVVLVLESEAGLKVAGLRMIGKHFPHLLELDFGGPQVRRRDSRISRMLVCAGTQSGRAASAWRCDCSAAVASPLATKSKSPLS